MHLPDGIVNNQTSFSFIAITVSVSGLAIYKAKDLLWEKTKQVLPQLATNVGLNLNTNKVINKIKLKKENINNALVIFSLIFTIQMVDFIHINGVSGHLIGSVLAAIFLGPWLGMLTVASVLVLQAVLLGDGGIVALGINIFNMAIVGSIGGYYLYFCLKKFIKNKYINIALTSWLSMVLMAIFFHLEVGQSYSLIFAHMLAGIAEAILTVLLIKYLFTPQKI